MKKKAFYDGNILASSIECKDANGKKSKKDGYSGKFTTEDFKAVQNPIVSYLLPRVPWLSMFIMAVLLILKHINFFNDEVVIAWLPIIISGYFVAGLCLFAQGLFMKKIPEIFIRVWCRKIIVCAYQFGVISGNNDSKNSKVIVPTNIHLEEKYLQFINEIQTRLNNSWQWFFGLIFLLLTFLWNPLKTLNNFPLLWNDSIALLNHLNQIEAWRSFVQDNWHLLNELPVSLIAFILGLMVWRMYVASSSVGKLVDKFQVEPKLGHLDLAGGLSPLGDLCLWNCIIASIPSIYISGWLFIGDLNKFQSPYADMPNYYIYEFLVLLFSLSVLPIMFCFILPLWKVHREMNNWRISKLERLHHVGYLIHNRESRLLNETEKIELNELEHIHNELEHIHNELEMMKNLYNRNKKLPTWPFNMEILGKLSLTYIFPVMGLISQIIQLILRLLK